MAGLRASISRVVRLEKAPGPEWTDGYTTVVPLATTATIGSGLGSDGLAPADSARGFFSWSWPSAVEVSGGDKRYRTRIYDATRWGQIAIVLCAVLVLIQMWTWTRRRKERS